MMTEVVSMATPAVLARARSAIREVERFGYRILSEAVDPPEVEEARGILRLAVGLRRKLDSWRETDG